MLAVIEPPGADVLDTEHSEALDMHCASVSRPSSYRQLAGELVPQEDLEIRRLPFIASGDASSSFFTCKIGNPRRHICDTSFRSGMTQHSEIPVIEHDRSRKVDEHLRQWKCSRA